MKVKVSLRFRGREMAHQEFGFGQVNRFLKDVSPWGHPDSPPKLIGKGINVMLSPLPRNKRARHPNQGEGGPEEPTEEDQTGPEDASLKPPKDRVPTNAAENKTFGQNPFASVDLNSRKQG